MLKLLYIDIKSLMNIRYRPKLLNGALFSFLLGIVFLFNFSNAKENPQVPKQTQAEPDTANQYGIFAAYNLNFHVADFQKLPGIPNCCQGFKNGQGSGFAIGAFMEMPLPYSLFAGLRASFSQLDGWLKQNEETWVRVDNDTLLGIFGHNLKTQYSTFGFEPYLRFKITDGLSISLGGRIAIPVIKNFQQWEEIVEPSRRGVFIDTQSRRRNEYSGRLPKAKEVQTDLHFAIHYDLPLNRRRSFLLSPFVSFHYGLTNIVDSLKWKSHSFRLGLALRYNPVEAPKVLPPTEKRQSRLNIDTLIVENEKIERSRFVQGKAKHDTVVTIHNDSIIYTELITRTDTMYRKPKPVAKIEPNTGVIYFRTQFVTQAFPLLPIVFFEYNSDSIGEFYKRVTKPEEFNYDSLPTRPLELNREILNIIGYRLTLNPRAKITIAGYADSTTEKADCSLARRRAESVKNYLVDIWGINPERIAIRTPRINCYPRERTITQNDSGFAENRRIEISSKDPEVLQPISKKRFLEVLDFKPKELIFNPEDSKLFGIKKWSLKVLRGGESILSYSGNANPRIIKEEVNNNFLDILANNQSLTVEFILEDIEGNIAKDIKQIKVVNDTSEVEIQRLSLILFNVSSADIPRLTQLEIGKFLKTNSELTQARILGYSDILGDRDYNHSLSEQRAQKTLDLIKKFDPNIEIIEVKGLGSSVFPQGLNSYSTPAERFLSRTVYIELIKKWK